MLLQQLQAIYVISLVYCGPLCKLDVTLCHADADVRDACTKAKLSASMCMQLLQVGSSMRDKTASSTKSMEPKGFQSTHTVPKAQRQNDFRGRDSASSQLKAKPRFAHAIWAVYCYSVAQGYELTASAMAGVWHSQSIVGERFLSVPSRVRLVVWKA